MNERRTASMLQRLSVVLAVTAASYGLEVPPVAHRLASGGRSGHPHAQQRVRHGHPGDRRSSHEGVERVHAADLRG